MLFIPRKHQWQVVVLNTNDTWALMTSFLGMPQLCFVCALVCLGHAMTSVYMVICQWTRDCHYETVTVTVTGARYVDWRPGSRHGVGGHQCRSHKICPPLPMGNILLLWCHLVGEQFNANKCNVGSRSHWCKGLNKCWMQIFCGLHSSSYG